MADNRIIGVARLIGPALAHALARNGEPVRGIGNFSTGKRENIADITRRVDFREVDLLATPRLSEVCRGFDYVLHQVAYSLPAATPKR